MTELNVKIIVTPAQTERAQIRRLSAKPVAGLL
jgi:hypothetical protein